MKTSLKVIACMAALAVLMVALSASAQGKLQGVWKITEIAITGPKPLTITNPQPSLMIFTEKYFSTTYVTSDQPRPDQPLEKATDAQKLAVWTSFMAFAGTYEVKGTSMTIHSAVAKNPEDMKPGNLSIFDFIIERNTLFLTFKATKEGPRTNPMTFKMVRVE